MENVGLEIFNLPIVQGKTFTRERVNLDGTHFIDCNFAECTIVYSGNAVRVEGCIFTPNTRWELRESAGMTIEVLRSVGWKIEYGHPDSPRPVARFS